MGSFFLVFSPLCSVFPTLYFVLFFCPLNLFALFFYYFLLLLLLLFLFFWFFLGGAVFYFVLFCLEFFSITFSEFLWRYFVTFILQLGLCNILCLYHFTVIWVYCDLKVMLFEKNTNKKKINIIMITLGWCIQQKLFDKRKIKG